MRSCCSPLSLAWDWKILPQPRNWMWWVSDRLWPLEDELTRHCGAGELENKYSGLLHPYFPPHPSSPPTQWTSTEVESRGADAQPKHLLGWALWRRMVSQSGGTKVSSKAIHCEPYSYSFSSNFIHKSFNNVPPKDSAGWVFPPGFSFNHASVP